MVSPEPEGGATRTCYDVLSEFDAAVRDGMSPGHEYFMLGGVPTAALVHADTVIDKTSQTVVAAPDCAPGLLRENGSRRDIDVLIGTVLGKPDSRKIKSNIIEATGNSLVVSVFGYDKRKETSTALSRTLRSGEFLSSRTVDEKGILRYELFPVEQVVPPQSYDPWRLQLPDGSMVQMLHPAGHVLAYRMRSISGLRHKDGSKYHAMRANVEPLFQPEINDGPFRPWLDFANTLYSIRKGHFVIDSQLVPGTMNGTLRLAQQKAQLLAKLESYTSLVNLVQGNALIQRLANIFVRAK